MEVMSNPTENYFHMVQSVADTHILTYVILLAYVCARVCACMNVCICVCVCVHMHVCTYIRMYSCMQFGNIKWGSTVGINENEKIYGLIIKNTE
jgi:hypothetical protein